VHTSESVVFVLKGEAHVPNGTTVVPITTPSIKYVINPVVGDLGSYVTPSLEFGVTLDICPAPRPYGGKSLVFASGAVVSLYTYGAGEGLIAERVILGTMMGAAVAAAAEGAIRII
jgi:hypothetical protein